MNKSNLDRNNSIQNKLKKLNLNINLCRKYKEEILYYTQRLKEKYQKGIFTYSQYEYMLNRYLKGKSLQYWMEHYNQWEKNIQRKIKELEKIKPNVITHSQHPKNIEIKRQKNFAWAYILIILIASLGIFLFRGEITGFVTIEKEPLVFSIQPEWNLEEGLIKISSDGQTKEYELSQFKISDEEISINVYSLGYDPSNSIKIELFIENETKATKILTTEEVTSEPNSTNEKNNTQTEENITLPKENKSKQENTTDPYSDSSNEENNTQKEENITYPQENITIPESNATNNNTQTKENITIPEENKSKQENITDPYSDSSNEENNTQKEENITYPQENTTLPNESNITIEENISRPANKTSFPEDKIENISYSDTLVQKEAIVNQPVMWIRKVYNENQSSRITLNIPKEAYKIKVEGIEIINGKEIRHTIDSQKILIDGKSLIEINQTSLLTGMITGEPIERKAIITKLIQKLAKLNIFSIMGFATLKTDSSLSISSYSPTEKSIQINQGETKKFSINISNGNKNEIETQWYVDNIAIVDEKNKSFEFKNITPGKYEVKVLVHNFKEYVTQKWELTVKESQSRKSNTQEEPLSKEPVDVQDDTKKLTIKDNSQFIEITYYTSPSTMKSKKLDNGKRIVVFSNISYKNVTVITRIEETRAQDVKLYKINNKSKTLYSAQFIDTNNNTHIDIVKWIIPHLRNQQAFEIDYGTGQRNSEIYEENGTFYIRNKDAKFFTKWVSHGNSNNESSPGYIERPEYFCTMTNSINESGADLGGELSFEIKELPLDNISKAEICAYAFDGKNRKIGVMNYIRKLDRSEWKKEPTISKVKFYEASKIIDPENGWKCIDITMIVKYALSKNEDQLFLRWIEEDANNLGYDHYTCFKTNSYDLSVCKENPYAAKHCDPFIKVVYQNEE